MKNSASNSRGFLLRVSFLSGAASSIGLFPYIIFLTIIFFTLREAPLGFLALFYLSTLVLSEYTFWELLKSRTSFKFSLQDFIKLKGKSYFWAAYFNELLFDGILLVTALKAGWNPLSFYMIYLGCRFLSGPIQTVLYNYCFSKNMSYLLAIGFQLSILLVTKKSDLLLYAVIIKGVFCNIISIARAQLADEIIPVLQKKE